MMTTPKSDSDPAAPESPDPDAFSDPIAGEILRHVHARGGGKSICPSEVARSFADQRRKPTDPPDLWRSYMNPVRQQAKALARAGHIVILRRGRPVDPHAPIKGLIRLSLPPETGTDAVTDDEPAPEGDTPSG